MRRSNNKHIFSIARYSIILASVLVFSLLTSAVFAQKAIPVQGEVFDENKAVIVGATIFLDDNQGNQFKTKTNSKGQYFFANIPAASYTLKVEANGFEESSQVVQVDSTSVLNLNIILKVTLNERLEVQAKGDSLTAISITGAKLNALPDDPRRFKRYIEQLAGVTNDSSKLAIYVDGFREDGNLPNKRAIAAIIVNSDPYSAQYAEPGKTRVEIITKPATEEFHGELNFNFNDESLNGRNAFATTRAPLQTRSLSGALSGPLKKENWGYFVEFSHNSQEENAFINATTLTPTTFQTSSFGRSVLTPIRDTSFSVRSSKLFGEKQTFNVRYGYSNEREENQGLESSFDLPERAVTRTLREHNLRFSLVSALSDHSLNETRVSWNREHSLSTAANNANAILVLENFNSGGNQENLFLDNVSQTANFENNFTYITGNHTLKFGGAAGILRLQDTDRSNFGGTFIFGTDFDRGATGLPVSGAALITPLESYRRTLQHRAGNRPLQFSIRQGDPLVALTQVETGFFASDDWKLSSQATISFGLRTEAQTNVSGVNLAPRAAISWRPFKNIEGTLRVGAGMFYSRVDSGITVDAQRFNGVRQTEIIVQRPSFFPLIPTEFNPTTVLNTVHKKANDLSAPYNFVTSVSYEQTLFKKLNATVGYTLERGVHLLRTRNLNAPILNQRPNPDLGAILQTESSGYSRRHELTIGLQSDLSDKLSFYSSYRLAFANSDTDGSSNSPANSYNLSNEFGRSGFDQRHQFYFETYLELPWKIGFSPNIFAASAQPFDILTGSDDNLDTIFSDRPAFGTVGGSGVISTRFGNFISRPQAGDTIIPRNFGIASKEISLNLNLSRTFEFGSESKKLSRRNIFARNYGLTFSVDVFNVLNHTNFTNFNNIVTSPLFGLPSRAGDSRRVNLGLSFSF